MEPLIKKPRSITHHRFLALGAALAWVVAIRNCVASGDILANTSIFPGFRFFPVIGVRGGRETWHGDASFAQRVCDRFVALRESRYFLTTS